MKSSLKETELKRDEMIFENLLLELIDEIFVRMIKNPEDVPAEFGSAMS